MVSHHVCFQELSKITMPVIFNEPLSFLQRLAEYMEHTFLVHQANACPDSVERMKVEKQPANNQLIKKNAASHVSRVFSVRGCLCSVGCGLPVGAYR